MVPYKNRWCKREHVESNVLNTYILLMIEFHLDLLPPKSKFTLINLNKGVQEFHKKFALALANKAANNVMVV